MAKLRDSFSPSYIQPPIERAEVRADPQPAGHQGDAHPHPPHGRPGAQPRAGTGGGVGLVWHLYGVIKIYKVKRSKLYPPNASTY